MSNNRPAEPGDTYHVTSKGYRRNTRTMRFEHVEVWERHHGQPVPDGHHIHHLDGDKLNNDPSNLRAVAPGEHNKIHSNNRVKRRAYRLSEAEDTALEAKAAEMGVTPSQFVRNAVLHAIATRWSGQFGFDPDTQIHTPPEDTQ